MPRTHVTTPADLLAAVPHLLGFHPSDSLVLLVLEGRAITLTLRTDLPPPRGTPLSTGLLLPPVLDRADAVLVVVVGGGGGDPPEVLPEAELAAALEVALAVEGVPVLFSVWTSETAHDARWFSYHDVREWGRVANPATSPVAAASAMAGHVTFRSREELRSHLSPSDPEALSRRAALLDRAVVTPADPARGRALVHAEVLRAATRKRPLTDEEVAALAHALSDLWVRDSCLAYAVGEHHVGAERLWTELTRSTPAPERAEPATLLAITAYLRGEGALARVALEEAEKAHPGHTLTTLLKAALDMALPPEKVRDLALKAAQAAWPPP
ncbi:DUF4192 domain-containing protein [Actinosynnema sp. NPDC020468]|uniref:DUF4192 domain-containing protein n=1 Tax=Actinosynnema sp. NPDC020468 TaxID=3154488 RepID=UPI0033ECEC9C